MSTRDVLRIPLVKQAKRGKRREVEPRIEVEYALVHEGAATYLSFEEWRELVQDIRVPLRQKLSTVLILSLPDASAHHGQQMIQIPVTWALGKPADVLQKILLACIETHEARSHMVRGMSFQLYETLYCSIDPHEHWIEFKHMERECRVSQALPMFSWGFSYRGEQEALEMLLSFLAESCLLVNQHYELYLHGDTDSEDERQDHGNQDERQDHGQQDDHRGKARTGVRLSPVREADVASEWAVPRNVASSPKEARTSRSPGGNKGKDVESVRSGSRRADSIEDTVAASLAKIEQATRRSIERIEKTGSQSNVLQARGEAAANDSSQQTTLIQQRTTSQQLLTQPMEADETDDEADQEAKFDTKTDDKFDTETDAKFDTETDAKFDTETDAQYATETDAKFVTQADDATYQDAINQIVFLLQSQPTISVPQLVDMLELDAQIVTQAIESLVISNTVSLSVNYEQGVDLTKLGSLATKLGPRTHINHIKQIGNPKSFQDRINKLVELRVILYNRATKVIMLNQDSQLLKCLKRFANNEATDEDVELLVQTNLAEPTSFQVPFVTLEQ